MLDASMKEDSCQIYQNYGAENSAMLQQISLRAEYSTEAEKA